MTIESIKSEIENLSDVEKAALAGWISRMDSSAWDTQIEQDFSAGGAGMDIVAGWDEQIGLNQSLPLEEFLEPRQLGQGH